MPPPLRACETSDPNLAFVLTGGGARAAYQVGVLRHLATRHPDVVPGIFTGVSAGGMIAMHLASRHGRFGDSVARLTEIWQNLRTHNVCRLDPVDLASCLTRWGRRLVARGTCETARGRSLAHTEPLRRLLTDTLGADAEGMFQRITRNLQAGVVRSIALTASSYMTGQSMTWLQTPGRFGALVGDSAREERIDGSLRVDHVLASGALPFIFPAVEIDGAWYGDGGMRLTAPLSPAIHLGARKIIAVSTRHSRSRDGMCPPAVSGHPQPGQVAGALLNAIFLDLLDADASRVQQFNALIDRLPEGGRGDLQQVDVLVLRPSQDLGRLANNFEAELPRGFRFLLRGLGSRETRSNDLLSLLMFQRDYISRLIDLGEADARARGSEIAAFLQPAAGRERPRPVLVAKPPDTPSRFGQSRRNWYHDTSAVPVLAG